MIIDVKNAENVRELLKAIAKHKKDLPKEIVSAAKAMSGNKQEKAIDKAKMRVEHYSAGRVSQTYIEFK